MTKELVPTNGFTPGKGQFLDYEADDGQVKIDVGLKDETVWLTQQRMADLFQNTKQNDGQHLKNIFFSRRVARKFSCKEILYNCRG